MRNITNRSSYYVVNEVDGINEVDLSSIDLSNFKFREWKYILVKSDEVGRPDLISKRVYGTSNYWWILLALPQNAISDIWNDLRVGIAIYCPSLYDMNNLLQELLNRKNQLEENISNG